MNNKTNNNEWKISAAEFKGFVKEKLEDLEERINQHRDGAEKRQDKIWKELKALNDYVVAEKAVKKYKQSIYGVLGGAAFMGLLYGLKWLVPIIINAMKTGG